MYTVTLPKNSGSDKMSLDRALNKLKTKAKLDGLFEEIKRRKTFMTKAEKKKRKQRNPFFVEPKVKKG